ncbi:hypothetical protein ACWDBO_07510 [Streptomyces mirabilis]|uniref:hypothetical protein n=1 Tax=Streptomyces TaxID=1883 RepID=UPI0029B44294|nr:hypothetical protein [Streptomyces sp. AK02-04a]MDX3755739.1 hypothetical protein [Streptomyces sp. AK02-04a]
MNAVSAPMPTTDTGRSGPSCRAAHTAATGVMTAAHGSAARGTPESVFDSARGPAGHGGHL